MTSLRKISNYGKYLLLRFVCAFTPWPSFATQIIQNFDFDFDLQAMRDATQFKVLTVALSSSRRCHTHRDGELRVKYLDLSSFISAANSLASLIALSNRETQSASIGLAIEICRKMLFHVMWYHRHTSAAYWTNISYYSVFNLRNRLNIELRILLSQFSTKLSWE